MPLASILTEIFEVGHERAAEVAKKINVDEFESNFKNLEARLGFEKASQVVKDGEFLDYRGKRLVEYFSLADKALAQMDPKYIPLLAFYSTEDLKFFIEPDKEKPQKINFSKFKVYNHKILHKDNENSTSYLNSLIEKGYVIIGRHEHWNKGSREGGTRGLNIIKKIAFELVMIFHELELHEPKYRIYHGQIKLTIPYRTKEMLRDIREAAYNSQSK